MATIRVRKRGKFAQIPNETLQDPSIRNAARGLLVAMLSYRDDWAFNMTHLRAITGETEHALRVQMQALIEAGYVRRWRVQRGWEYEVYESLALASASRDSTPAESTSEEASSVKSTDVESGGYIKTERTTNTYPSTKTEKHSSVSELSEVPQVAELVPQAARVSEAEAFVALWNEHRGPLPACLTLTSKREKGILKFLEEVPRGANPTAVFRAAVAEVAGDAFWAEKKYNLDNLLVPGRIIEKAEKHAAGPAPKRNATEAAERATGLAERIRARREQNQ